MDRRLAAQRPPSLTVTSCTLSVADLGIDGRGRHHARSQDFTLLATNRGAEGAELGGVWEKGIQCQLIGTTTRS